jgi:hypothetical protein
MKNTIHSKLVAKQDGIYKNYVFQNLDQADNSIFKYITVTECPNWNIGNDLKIGDIGFVEYEFVEAGEDYFKRSSQETKQYNFTTNYFLSFIKEKQEINTEYKF